MSLDQEESVSIAEYKDLLNDVDLTTSLAFISYTSNFAVHHFTVSNKMTSKIICNTDRGKYRR